jgi:predicted molibdopterin-dependent oxidoreductase YjgC
MFERFGKPEEKQVMVFVEDKPVVVAQGDNVAVAVFSAGYDHTRHSPVSGAHRSPYCMMGVCFECLVEIDGVSNQQACMTPVRSGMRIKLQRGARGIDS